MTNQMDEIDAGQQKEIDALKAQDKIHDLLLEQYRDHNTTLKGMIFGGMVIFAIAISLFGALLVCLAPRQ